MSAQPPFEETKIAEATAAPKTANPAIKIVLLTLSVVLLCAASAGGAWYFMNRSHDTKTKVSEEEPEATAAEPEEAKEEAEGDEEKPVEPVFVTLEPFTVNLLPEGQFLQTTLVLQVKDEKAGEVLKVYMPQIRSRLLLMLSGKTAEALSSPQGKNELIKEVKQLVSQPFKPGQKPVIVDDVLLTAFIIQ